jgi:hypothetical protein
MLASPEAFVAIFERARERLVCFRLMLSLVRSQVSVPGETGLTGFTDERALPRRRQGKAGRRQIGEPGQCESVDALLDGIAWCSSLCIHQRYKQTCVGAVRTRSQNFHLRDREARCTRLSVLKGFLSACSDVLASFKVTTAILEVNGRAQKRNLTPNFVDCMILHSSALLMVIQIASL